MSGGIIKMRSGQRHLFELVEKYRTLAFVARRQYGKTTSFANIALMKMMRTKRHTVIFGSAKLNLSREIIRKEAAVMADAIAASRRDAALTIADQASGKPVAAGIDADGFAELFEAQRLEFRYYHGRDDYSRTKVVALRADAVGETGDLMLDEVGRINNWRDVWEAVEPIVASNPDFRLLISTTPPPDSSHFSFDQLAPPPDMKFEPNPSGNIYESIGGITVLRLDAADAFADGVPLYDAKSGKPMSPEEARAKARDKDAHDRNYGCMFLEAGAAAVSYAALADAQAAGFAAGCVYAEDDLPLGWQRLFLGGGDIGVGGDPATTEGDTSNPFGLTISQRLGAKFAARLILSMKTPDPKKPKEILREIAKSLKPRAVVLDATSERFWCAEVKEELAPFCEVKLIVSSEKCEEPDAPRDTPVNWKNYLGKQAVSELEDRNLLLPPGEDVKDDFRLVRRHKGGYTNALDSATGRHGDLFDSTKNSLHALRCDCGEVEIEAAETRDRPQPQPRRWDRPPSEYEDTLNAANAGRYLP